MFERIDYRVIRIDGEYAYLQKLEDENAEEKCVAMALLPPEIQEGCHIAYEMMEYRMINDKSCKITLTEYLSGIMINIRKTRKECTGPVWGGCAKM